MDALSGDNISATMSVASILFEVLGRRRNLDPTLGESQEWFPMWVWKKFERREINGIVVACRIEEKNEEKAERMAMVAFWCVRCRPALRPCMSVVAKMLGGWRFQHRPTHLGIWWLARLAQGRP